MNATIPIGTPIYNVNTGAVVILAYSIRVKVTIIPEDIQVSLFTHDSIEYTVSTIYVIFD